MERMQPQELMNPEQFRKECLRLLAINLKNTPYPTYPSHEERLFAEAEPTEDPVVLPLGPWETSNGEMPTDQECYDLRAKGLRLDVYGRPLHPWFDEMLTDPTIGVVTGKGFYRKWGPNYTADPVIMRYDLEEPYVLLITRGDTGQWALPGGFIDPTDTDSEVAARREGREEALLNLDDNSITATLVYKGIVADPRTTVNSWPETTAYRLDVPEDLTRGLSTEPYKAGDDADIAQWKPVSNIEQNLFGSHRLIVKLALSS